MALDLESYTTTVPAGQSLSPPVPLGVKVLVGLAFDSAFTSPTGGVTFQVRFNGYYVGKIESVNGESAVILERNNKAFGRPSGGA